MTKNYLILAIRNLLRNKFQSLFSIVGLAVAFFCFGICAYFVHGFLSMDHYYRNHDRVLQLCQEDGVHGIHNSFDFDAFMQQFPEVEAYIRIQNESNEYMLDDREGNIEMRTIECDTTLRHIYNPRLIAGSWEAAENSPNSFLLTESLARRLFGDPLNAIGQQFHCMGGKRYSPDVYSSPTYTVQAVVEDLAYNNTLQPFTAISAWVMNDTDGVITFSQSAVGDGSDEQNAHSHMAFFYDPRILLRQGVDPEQFIQKMRNTRVSGVARHYADGTSYTPCLTAEKPFDAIRQYENYAIFATVLLVILLPGLLILLSAMSNFFHLLISNIMMRRREYTLRRAHGAHTWDLWLMVSTQVIVTLLLVGVATMIIVELCSSILNIRIDSTLEFSLDRPTMLIQSAEHLVVLLLIGLAVAWLAVARIRKDSLQESLKTSTGRRPGRHVWRNILMGWQMFIGFIFITLLAAILLQVRVNEKAQYPWLTDEQKQEIVELPFMIGGVPTSHEEYVDAQAQVAAVEAELKAMPSVKDVQLYGGYQSLMNNYGNSSFKVLNTEGDTLFCHQTMTPSGLLEFIEVPVFEGRLPEKIDEVVVDQNLVDAYHVRLGDKLTLCNEENGTMFYGEEGVQVISVTIVGIIDNFSAKSRANNAGAYEHRSKGIYFASPFITGHFIVKSHPGRAEQMQGELNKHFSKHELFGGREVNLELPSLYDEIHQTNNMERQFLSLFWLFAGIALIITLLGIYSAITMDTTARRKEMAIRKINGAKAHHIAARFGRLYLVLMVVTAAIAFPLTYIFFHYVGQMGYRETFSYGFWFYLGIFVLMGLFVALTVGLQIWRIANINPAKIVKEE